MADVRRLSSVVSYRRCPKCSDRGVTRSATEDGRDSDGFALWDLLQTCIMCGWTKLTAHVKVGV